MFKKVVGLVVMFSLCLFTLAFAKSTIKIGLMCPQTGNWASEGLEMKRIVTLLAEQINNKGGVLGKKIEIIDEDDGGDPRTAALAANKLVTRGIVAVIGTYGSSVTEATQNIFNENKIIQIANGSTAIRLTEKGYKYFFRTAPRDDQQGKVAAKAIKKFGFKKVAILHDNTTYSKGLAEETKHNLEQMGGFEIVFFDALTPGERDYTTVLTKLKAAKPDVVFFSGYYPEAGILLKQKKEMGWDVPFIGGDATNNPDLVKIAGVEAAKGFYFLSPPVPQDLDTPEAKAFLKAYKEKYNELPGSVWAVLSGDALLAIVKAIEGTKSTDPDKMANFLHYKLKDMPGLTGKISFDEKGDRVGDLYRVYMVDENGNFVIQP